MDHLHARLEAENQRLRERVEILEDALFGAADDPLPLEWRLTGCEARLFRALCARSLATKEYLLLAISSLTDDAPGIKIVDVFICKMRKKIAPYGIEITTIWGQGYSLPESVRQLYKAKTA